MILLKSDDGIVVPICIWDGYNDKDELDGCVLHSTIKEIRPFMNKVHSGLGIQKFESQFKEHCDENEVVLPKSWKGLNFEFSDFDEIWYQGFEYSEQLYFTYKTENLEKTISLTGYEVVDGYITIEGWKASGVCTRIAELDEDIRDREYRRYLNGLLEYLMMMSNGKRIPVRPNMGSERKEARTIIRKQKPFSLKDVLGWKMFTQKDSDGGANKDDSNKNDENSGHNYDEGRNHFLHRDFSPEEVQRLSTKVDFSEGVSMNPELPEQFSYLEMITAHGMISHRWGKKGEDTTLGFEEYLQDMDKAA